jgi:hypothetical protein
VVGFPPSKISKGFWPPLWTTQTHASRRSLRPRVHPRSADPTYAKPRHILEHRELAPKQTFRGPASYNCRMFERHRVVIITVSGGRVAVVPSPPIAPLVVSDINEVGGHETVRLIEQRGGRATFCRADIADDLHVQQLIELAESTFGGLPRRSTMPPHRILLARGYRGGSLAPVGSSRDDFCHTMGHRGNVSIRWRFKQKLGGYVKLTK